MIRLLLAPALCAALLLLPGCGALTYDAGVPSDWEIHFTESSGHLRSPAELRALLTAMNDDVVYVNLVSHGSMPVTDAANAWAKELNKKRSGIAEPKGHSVILRRILKIEIDGKLRGITIREIGPTK